MKFVKRIISEKRVGQTSDGHGVDVNQVEYVDGTKGALYRLNRCDGKIYGLQQECPVVQTMQQGILVGAVTV